jgi:hypothetical protein
MSSIQDILAPRLIASIEREWEDEIALFRRTLRVASAALFLFAAIGCSAPGVPPAHDPRPIYGQPCDHGQCPSGYSCRYARKNGSPHAFCDLEVGRCRFASDCPPSLACQRFGEALGVCSERGL